MLPEALKKLIHELTKLPGVGPRSAERIALWLVTDGRNVAGALSQNLIDAASNVALCPICGTITVANELCSVYADPARDRTHICVVQGPLDAVAIERSRVFDGTYHVLGGVLSPLDGVTPEDLRIADLIERVKKDNVVEIIVATNPSAEGDVTAQYIADEVRAIGVKVTRIACGLPSGGQVDYADTDTLEKALKHRVEL
jgi:recombination protein RecR